MARYSVQLCSLFTITYRNVSGCPVGTLKFVFKLIIGLVVSS